MTPNLLMLGRENQPPIEVIGTGGTSTSTAVTSYGEYVNGQMDHMQRAHDVARKYSLKKLREKESYNAKQSLIQYQPVDLVMYGTEISQLDIAPKLRVTFQGPYLVLAKLGD